MPLDPTLYEAEAAVDFKRNSELARLGVTGGVWTAPKGTAIPTGLDAWPAGWLDVGWISDDGLTESLDEDTETFTPWQSFTPIRTEVTSSTKTFQFTAWESSATTVSLYYRVPLSAMQEDATSKIVTFDEKGKPPRDLRMFGFDVIDGDYHRRIVCPLAEITERGDIEYKSDTMIGYEMTISAYPGPDGYSVRRMFKEGWSPKSNGGVKKALTVDPAAPTIAVGATETLTAKSGGTAVTGVNWTSADTAKVTVTNAGVVTGVAAGGPTAVTATKTGYNAGAAAVTVTAKPAIAVTPATAKVKVNATQQLTAKVGGSNATGVTWSSSATGTATVSNAGLVTGVAAGTATITAKKSGHTDGTSTITVET